MEPGTATRPIKQGRPGVIVLIAFVVQLVAIASLANQVVTKHLKSYVGEHPYAFPGRLVEAMLVYQWRLGSQPGDRANEPIAHTCLDLVVLALTALLVYAVTRGAITFVRAFVGTWLAVIAATLVGQVVFGLISPPPYPPRFSHLQGALFLVPDGFGFIAGVVLGFVTALFAAIFAVATRRTIRPAPAAGYPDVRDDSRYERQYDPGYDRPYDQPDWSERTTAYPRSDYGGYYGAQVGGPPPPPYSPTERTEAYSPSERTEAYTPTERTEAYTPTGATAAASPSPADEPPADEPPTQAIPVQRGGESAAG